jgi:fructokinase
MPKLWFLGEALIDFVPVPAPDGGPAYAPRCGGSPYNAAKAAALAGAEVGFLGALSTDLFGEMLAADLARHGIDTRAAPRLPAPTTLAFVDLQSGEPRYAFFNEGTATRRVAPDPAAFAPRPGDVVDFGSISLIDLPGADAIAAFAEAVAGRALVAIDPNARPGMTPDLPAWRRRIGRILAVADIVRLSVEDLVVLAPGESPAAFAAAQIARGARLVVVTHGAEGAEAWTAAAHVRVPGHRVEVADTVGAGDTLMGTLLAHLASGGHTHGGSLALLPEDALAAALRHAVAAAALNCMASGCAPPTPDAVAAFLTARAAAF